MAMMDWAGNVESRNYGIKRQTDRRYLCDLLTITASVVLLAAAFGYYAWVRSEIVDLGYQEQSLRIQEEDLCRAEKNLILEEQTLKNPERIEYIAQTELGMVPLQTNQVLSPELQDADLSGSTAIALATAPSPSPEPRKPSASN
jgi:cell division protein FtsL